MHRNPLFLCRFLAVTWLLLGAFSSLARSAESPSRPPETPALPVPTVEQRLAAIEAYLGNGEIGRAHV